MEKINALEYILLGTVLVQPNSSSSGLTSSQAILLLLRVLASTPSSS